MKFKIIGAGGIGGYLVEPLCRYIEHTQEGAEVTVFDGDKYEPKNSSRQRFTELQNKAEHTVSSLRDSFQKIRFKYKSEYLTPKNIVTSIREEDVVFLCVDNHATRKLVSDRCSELDNVVLISGGNDYTDGNVIVYIRKDGVDVTKSLTDIHEKIANPQDENPGSIVQTERSGCEQETQSSPQLLFMNLAIASSMCNCYYAWEQNRVNFHQVYLDILTHKMRPSPEPQFDC